MSGEYVYVPYPAWRYHRTEAPRLVQSPAEDKALGPGWADSPAAFVDAPEPEPEAEPEHPAEPPPGSLETALDATPSERRELRRGRRR